MEDVTHAEVAVDGARLAVRRWRADGAPILLVHGLASNARTWDGVAEALVAAGHDVAAVDLRGHGASPDAETGHDTATAAGDVLAVADALGMAQPVLAGQSWGGNVVVAAARLAPGAVRGLALVDGGAIELQDRWPAWEDCAAELAPPRHIGMDLAALAVALRRAHPSWSDAGVAATLGNVVADEDGAVRNRLDRDAHLSILRSLWEDRPSAHLHELRCGVLMLVAGKGRASWSDDTRREVARVEAGAPRSRVRWYPDGDHDLHVERPDEVAAQLLAAHAEGLWL
jgi:pimeloyl-ACP methyl ester carboxylesterase